MPHSITVLSNKGGTGKTPVAVNIVKKLVDDGKKVALLDLDLDSAQIPNGYQFEVL